MNPDKDNSSKINTGGGAYIGGNVDAGGDFIGRDKVIIQRLDLNDVRNQRNHAVLRQAVKSFWIDGVLKNSLHKEVLIRLKLDSHPEKVDNRPWKLVLQQAGQADRTIADDKAIIDIFDEMGQRLLILGEPGSGKTTTLLTLADSLLTIATKDPTQPTPVIFNLSSWAEQQPPLEEWLIYELNTRYLMPRKVAEGWVTNDELMLMLDGLDEVAEAKREACVKAINDFRMGHVVGIAVCSRTVEYEALTTQLKLVGAVRVRSLTSEQIEDYLGLMGSQATALRHALVTSAELRDLAQTPLMLSVMTLAYQGTNDATIQNANRSEVQHLFDRYIARMFKHRELSNLYTHHDTLHWLHWLAGQMVQRAQTIFLIEHLQPDWLLFHKYSLIYRVLTGTVIGGIAGVFGYTNSLVYFFATRNWTLSLSVTLFSGLYLGLAGGLLSQKFIKKRIRLYEQIKWSWRRAIYYGLVSSFSSVLYSWMAPFLYDLIGISLEFNSVAWIIPLWITLGFLVGGLRFQNLGTKSVPNQGIYNSMKHGLLIGAVGGLTSGLIYGLVAVDINLTTTITNQMTEKINELGWGVSVKYCGPLIIPTWSDCFLSNSIYNYWNLTTGLSIGVTIFIFSFLLSGGISGIAHGILRLLLYYQNSIPWNYARFLDYCVDRIFLRRVGGGYIFIHGLVMEHFASLTDEDIERIARTVDGR